MRVITFSTKFPVKYPRAGEPTFFEEKIWYGLSLLGLETKEQSMPYSTSVDPKYHTIRAGNKWKVGDFFSPRVWSGKPYASKQIEIAPPIEIKKIWEIKMEGYFIWLNGRVYNSLKLGSGVYELANNDGLSTKDFWDWFPYKPGTVFNGQIICWNENINY